MILRCNSAERVTVVKDGKDAGQILLKIRIVV